MTRIMTLMLLLSLMPQHFTLSCKLITSSTLPACFNHQLAFYDNINTNHRLLLQFIMNAPDTLYYQQSSCESPYHPQNMKLSTKIHHYRHSLFCSINFSIAMPHNTHQQHIIHGTLTLLILHNTIQ